MPDDEPRLVVKLEPQEITLCPGKSETIKATTNPPEAVVAWFINDIPVTGEPGDRNTRRVFGNDPGGHTIIVRAELDNSLSATVNVIAADLRIELDPEPVNGNYEISAEPKNPVITATAIGIGGPVSGVTWKYGTSFEGTSCPPHGSGDLLTSSEFTTTGNPITIDLGDKFRGGGLGISASGTVNGCHVFTRTGGGLLATNPEQTEIQDALPHDALRRIACRESGQRQFDAPANGGTARCPLIGCGGRVGIMQIADPADDEVWEWRANVAKGIEIFNEKVAEGKDYPKKVRTSEEFNHLVFQFNELRQQQNLDPIQVVLPDFTVGNFDDDLQQLELDAIRGYNGWFGSDRFGFELHEFRVAVDEIDGEEVLRVTKIDEQALKGEAIWERVPVKDRPIGEQCGDPNYVDSVLGLLAGCGGNGAPKHSCTLNLTLIKRAALSFSPPSLTGKETFTVLLGQANLPGNTKLKWMTFNLEGFTGTVLVDPAEALNILSLTSEITARHPNKARLQAQLVDKDGNVICSENIDISVPQFFHVVFLPEFERDLELVGLKRRPPDDGTGLTPGQIETNQLVRQAVIDEALRTARSAYKDINVRFTVDDPTSIVGSKNFTTVAVGGPFDPAQPTSKDPFGFAAFDKDNEKADGFAFVVSEEFADRSHTTMQDQIYLDIFDELAIEDQDGTKLPGKPVDAGEFPDGAMSVRKKHVKAAIMAFGRLIGIAIAHECGHTLGLPDNTHPGNIMGPPDFRGHTGITSFNAETGDLTFVDPVKFRVSSLMTLFGILPIISAN